jgi:prevent-host-death family protein
MNDMINVYEAKTHFSKLLARVIAGEDIIIAKSGKPVARLVPIPKKIVMRQPGSAKGQIIIADDFDDPLPADILEAFTG